jgi:hypothetical protein
MGMLLVVLLSALMLCPSGCSMVVDYKIIRIPVELSEVFYIGDRPRTDQAIKDVNNNQVGTLKGSSWLADDDEDGEWEAKFATTSTANYRAGGPDDSMHYDGVRLVGIDQELIPRDQILDISGYDGIVFKYKSNSDASINFYDKSYHFTAPGGLYTAWGYMAEGGRTNPDITYREVVIPFSNLGRVPVIDNASTDDYNLENFDRDQFIRFRLDAREPEDSIGGVQLSGDDHQAWSEIIDFDFFVYE